MAHARNHHHHHDSHHLHSRGDDDGGKRCFLQNDVQKLPHGLVLCHKPKLTDLI